MKVLYAASECAPFLKTGGLGDVIGALPKAVINEGVDARVVMPLYKNIPDELKSKMDFLSFLFTYMAKNIT